LPLIITHGWPGSVIEMLEVIGPLTDPAAHGGAAADAFDLVIPSLPGYGFSDEPTSVGWDPGRIARAWAELMRRLGYTRYVAQGGDQGAAVTDAMGGQAPEGLALLASPVALAAWMLDHDTDSYYKISRAFTGGQPAGNLTRDHILDNITLYWLTGTGASAARSYWEGGQAAARAAGQAPPQVSLPVGFTVFPGEIFQAPRSWADKLYPNLTYFHQAGTGGHFAAWEEPQLFSEELRAGFRALR
jgi:pimeloyl-ACP methyl ester carboxylesterase